MNLKRLKNSIMKEVDKCKEQENLINENVAKLDLLRKAVESSVDKKDFKYEVDRLSSKIRGIGLKWGAGLPAIQNNNEAQPEFDPELIGPLEDKIFNLEERLNALRIQSKSSEEKLKLEWRDLKLNKWDYSTGKELKQAVEKLQSKIEDVDKLLKNSVSKTEDEIEALIIERIKPIEEDSKDHGDIILQITQRIQRIEVKIENISKITSAQKSKGDRVDVEKVNNIEHSIRSLVKDIEAIRRNHSKKVEEIMKSIYFKCDKSEVASIESKLFDNLGDLVQSMYNKFSDKAETNENMQMLDKQLKNLFEVVMSKK